MADFVKRQVLRYEAPPNAVGGKYINCGVPQIAPLGGCAVADGLSGTANAIISAAEKNVWQYSTLKLDLSHIKDTHSPLMGIAIAPDSPIHTVDIWLETDGELGKHRVSPGNPLITDLSKYDVAYVSVPQAMGRDMTGPDGTAGITVAAYLKNHIAWDCAGPVSGKLNDTADAMSFSWPVRLNLFYGNARPSQVHMRAPYHASVAWALYGAGYTVGVDPDAVIVGSVNTEEAVLWVCTQGRTRVNVKAFRTDDNAADNEVRIRVYGGDAYPQLATAGIENHFSQSEDWIVWTELDAGTYLVRPTNPGPGYTNDDVGGTSNIRAVPYAFAMKDNPFAFFKVIIETPHTIDPTYAKYAFGNLMVDCWDGP